MRCLILGLVVLVISACDFPRLPRLAADGGELLSDASTDILDRDAPTDTSTPERTRAGLIALWEFEESSSTTIIADTSGTAHPVPLTIKGSALYVDGTLWPSSGTTVESAPSPHLNGDITLARAVTLEAWVMSMLEAQGSATTPVVVAGLSGSVNARNISLLQAGARWVGRVRTSSDANGGPDLTSAALVTARAVIHLVLVCDATQRVLYVDGQPAAVDPAPAGPLAWDNTFPMELGAEHSGAAQWSGTFALVAMYARALGPELVLANFRAGPDAR